MLFRSKVFPKTWDAWMHCHEGAYYLYYLIAGEEFLIDGFGAATSRDGVRWEDHGRALHRSDKLVGYLGTGSVWKDPRFAETGRFLCNYSEWRMDGDRMIQNILFAWSDDLLQWNKFGDDHMFKIDEQFYQRINEDARGPWEWPRWDGMCAVPRPGDGYYGYWTATPRDFLGFGFGESDDGVHWRALEPPQIDWGDAPQMRFVEVGGVHELEGHYFAMLADYASDNCGVFAFVADTPSGPFRPCARNFGLLRNQSKMHAYFSRFLDSPDGVLVNHHALAEGQFSEDHYVVYFSPLKKATVLDTSLYLTWWDGNDELKSREVDLPTSDEQRLAFETDTGMVLEGTMELPGSLVIGYGEGRGTRILVNGDGVTEIGTGGRDEAAFNCEERIDREIPFGACPRFRLLLNYTMLEFYLDDFLIQCYTMEKPSDGTIWYRNANDLRLWQWE